MKNVCIVTDSTVQFPKPFFPGRELIHILSFDVYYDGQILSDHNSIRPNQLPKVATSRLKPRLVAPEPETIKRTLLQLSQNFETIYAVFLSREISSMYQNAAEAVEEMRGKINIQLVDSKTTSVGLGLLILQLIDGIHLNENPDQIDHRLRTTITRLYTLFCTPSLSYMHFNGFIEKTQSLISELLGIVPIFAVEDGAISPIEKVKTFRHALTYYQEFVDEFDDVEHIAYVQSAKPNFKDAKIFHDSVMTAYPNASFSKHPINLPLSILFGPGSTCLIVLENS